MASSAPSGFIDFEIVGNKLGVQAMLERVDSALSPIGMAEFLGLAIGPWIKARAQDRFDREGDDVSGKWLPLSDTTVEIRENMGFSGAHPINRRTGELEEYVTQGSIGIINGPGVSTLRYPNKPPATKSLREKMTTAQKGRSHPNTPPRRVLGLNERDLMHTLTMLAFHVQGRGVTARDGSAGR